MELLQIFALAFIVGFLISRMSSGTKRENIAYPFFPIDPMNVDPFETQAVFGQPEYLFQLSTTPRDADYGAYQSLQAAQNMFMANQALGIDWQTNQGFNPTGNADYNLMLSNPPISAWNYL